MNKSPIIATQMKMSKFGDSTTYEPEPITYALNVFNTKDSDETIFWLLVIVLNKRQKMEMSAMKFYDGWVFEHMFAENVHSVIQYIILKETKIYHDNVRVAN